MAERTLTDSASIDFTEPAAGQVSADVKSAGTRAILDLHLNVKDYGALGDGTTATVDAQAFQDAITACVASGGEISTVYAPNPEDAYVFNTTVTIPAGITIIGDNKRGLQLSRIKPATSFTDPFFETDDHGSSRVLRIGLIGLYLDGSSTTLTAVQANCQESMFRDLTIKNCFTYGLHIAGVGSGATEQALNNHIINCYLAGTIGTAEFFDGIFLDNNTADNTITGCYIEACKDAGIRSRAYNDKITNNHIYSVSGSGGGKGAGYYSETSADIDFSHNYVELCDASGVFIDGGASDVETLNAAIIGNVFRNIDTGDTESGVVVIQGSNVSSVTVIGNAVRRDASTSYSTAYFVFFSSISPTLQAVFGNVWQSGLVTTGETNGPHQRLDKITFDIDGGGSAITTGVKGYVEIPFACTITAARALADQSGSIVVDVWKDTYANYPPTNDDSITASAPVTITTATKSEDTTLTGWTTSIAAGDILGFNVDSITTVERVTISLTIKKVL